MMRIMNGPIDIVLTVSGLVLKVEVCVGDTNNNAS